MGELVNRFGEELTIANLIMGSNLNLRVVRGFASLDQLALISAPDVFDEIKNPLGTQRDPDKKHAQDALDYALESQNVSSVEAPHAFSEIILNVRDTNVIRILKDGLELDLGDINETSGQVFNCSIKILNTLIDESREIDPQISRVDGNHRLLKVREYLFSLNDDDLASLPMVPFAIFVGLTPDQERSLFKDINGTQKTMNTSHLAQIRERLEGNNLLLDIIKGGRPLWISQRLLGNGGAFAGKVYKGGGKSGYKQTGLPIPPVTLASLKTAINKTLSSSDQLEAIKIVKPENDELTNLVETYEARAQLINRFWLAVAKAYPEAWQDKKNYVLLQSIGLSAMSKLAGKVIDEGIRSKKATQSDFDIMLKHVASLVNLKKENFEGIAGESGANVVFKQLFDAMNDGLDVAFVIDELINEPHSDLDTEPKGDYSNFEPRSESEES